MHTNRLVSLTGALFVSLALALPQQIPDALFEMRELDFHLHSGMEREVDIDAWLSMAAADGRKAVVMLDHLELYRKTPDEYAKWKHNDQPPYQLGPAGHRQLMSQFDAAAARHKDLLIFKGWEISEGELDTGMDLDAMRMADVVGWHISPNNGHAAPDGQTLLRRVEQVKKAQRQVPIPMILFHPFTMRLENIQRTAKAAGRDVKTLTVGDYRFFHGNEQQQLADTLQGSSIYIEISNSSAHYFEDPVCREALIADILPLAKMGVQFTVSTDAHNVGNIKQPFRPEAYCADLGCTASNTNTILRELLALRAKKTLAQRQ